MTTSSGDRTPLEDNPTDVDTWSARDLAGQIGCARMPPRGHGVSDACAPVNMPAAPGGAVPRVFDLINESVPADPAGPWTWIAGGLPQE